VYHMYGQFFPTAEESIEYYNQKRCVDGKGLILPSQIVSNPQNILIYLYNSCSVLYS
jgi:phosphatidylinositol-3,4,5-trisphosphate 3-phosphatase/dual-specificity protein phosphatase PTEN